MILPLAPQPKPERRGPKLAFLSKGATKAFRSGYVCILGRPNAGKSTLLNALVGEKVAIISPKPQTTRNRILGIVHVPKTKGRNGGQIVLLDTPGVHKPDSSLGRKMMVEVREALEGCNLVLLLMDATRKLDQRDQFALQMMKQSKTPTFLVLNKVDLLRGEKSRLLPLIEEYRKLHAFQEIIPISALRRDGLEVLLDRVIALLPAGPSYFPEDQVTDQPTRFMAAEMIREQVLAETEEEIPYATTVIVDNFEEGRKLTRIAATIYCDRVGQKAILVGKGGQMLKKIGTGARLQMERMLGMKVYLELFVKAQPGWRDSGGFVEELDWRRQLQHQAVRRVDQEDTLAPLPNETQK
jgi:GTP-binding protein Era